MWVNRFLDERWASEIAISTTNMGFQCQRSKAPLSPCAGVKLILKNKTVKLLRLIPPPSPIYKLPTTSLSESPGIDLSPNYKEQTHKESCQKICAAQHDDLKLVKVSLKRRKHKYIWVLFVCLFFLRNGSKMGVETKKGGLKERWLMWMKKKHPEKLQRKRGRMIEKSERERNECDG